MNSNQLPDRNTDPVEDGKVCTIEHANRMHAKRVLVVCPAKFRYQWVKRIRQWSTMGTSYDVNAEYEVPNTLVYAITSGAGGVHDTAAWTVISPELLRNGGLHRALGKGHYDLLINDADKWFPEDVDTWCDEVISPFRLRGGFDPSKEMPRNNDTE